MKKFYLFFMIVLSITYMDAIADLPHPPNIFYSNFFVEGSVLKVTLYWYRDPITPTSDITRFNVYRANAITEDLSEFTFIEEVVSSDTSVRSTLILPNEGNYTFYVTAINTDGESEHSNFRNINAELKVTFNTNPVNKIILPNTYTYDADATYSIGGEINYELTEAPAGMAVDEVSGLVSWTPTAAGSYNIELKAYLVSEPTRAAIQNWTLAVDASEKSLEFVTSPPLSGEVGTEYYYNAEVECTGCLPGDNFRFFLLNAPSGMTVHPDDGVVSWTPSSPGNYDVHLRVMVAGDSIAKEDQSWTIEVTGSERILRVYGYLRERDSTIFSDKKNEEILQYGNPIQNATFTIEFYDENHNLLDTHNTLTDANGYFDLRWAEDHDGIAVSRGLFLPKFTFPIDSATKKAKYKWFYKTKDGNGTQDPWMAVVVVFTSEDEDEDLGVNYADPETDEPLLNLRVYGKITYKNSKIVNKKHSDIPLAEEIPAENVKVEVEFYDENYNLSDVHGTLTDGNGEYDLRWAENHDGIDVSRGLFLPRLTIPGDSVNGKPERWFYFDKNGEPTQDVRCASEDDIVFLYPEYNPVNFNVDGLDSETEVILNKISGVIVDNKNNDIPSSVFLMKYNDEKLSYTDFLCQTNTTTKTFSFSNIQDGKYIIRVRPDVDNFASNYYSKEGTQINDWRAATVLDVDGSTNLSSLKIVLSDLSKGNGSGKISGKVKSGKNSKLLAGLLVDESPGLGGANVYLMNESNTIIHDFDNTTNRGEFEFNNISTGSYKLVFDRAPYNPKALDILVDAETVIDTSIILNDTYYYVEDNSNFFNLEIKPQPADESIIVTIKNCNGNVSGFLYNSNMELLSSFNDKSTLLYQRKINTSDLPSGFYLMVIKDGIYTYTKSFLILK